MIPSISASSFSLNCSLVLLNEGRRAVFDRKLPVENLALEGARGAYALGRMYRIPRYAEGKKRFTEHYLMSRTSALREAEASILDGREPDIARLAASNDVPPDIQPLMKDLLATLIRHYSILLRAEGSDFDSLVRSAYHDRAAFLQVMDRLNEAERIFP